jgi:hypothetical protein
MFKAGTVARLTSAQSLVHDTQKDVNKESIAEHKERNSTTRSARNLNGAQHGVRPLVEMQILHFLLLFFDIFLILYDLNKKHTNFQLNWTEDVACRNSTIFSTKFKAPSRVRVRCLRSRIWASSRGQTRLGFGLVGCEIWFYPIKKSTSIRVRMQKLWPFCWSMSGLRFWKAEYDSESKSGKAKTCCLWWQRMIQWMERLKQGFTMNLGLAKREFT